MATKIAAGTYTSKAGKFYTYQVLDTNQVIVMYFDNDTYGRLVGSRVKLDEELKKHIKEVHNLDVTDLGA